MNDMTPMLKQYMGIKSDYPDAILFYRMGDFYEMFFEDAKVASRTLGIALTSRGTYNGEKVPMCGVPHHASKSYVAKLIEAGLKVAVCEQMEDPKQAKGIVDEKVKKTNTSIRQLKQNIKSLKDQRRAAIESKDRKMATIYKRRISRLKKKTRRAAI